MNVSAEDYDILIAGGGLVGSSLAAALVNSPWRVGVIESRPFGDPGQPSFDERSLALSWTSRRIFEGIGIWGALSPDVEPIHHVHVSQTGYLGVTHIDAREQGVPALGYVAPTRVIGAALSAYLKRADNVKLISPATVDRIRFSEDRSQVCVNLAGEATPLSARLLAVCDGTFSPLREQLGIQLMKQPYGQSALIANLRVDSPQPGIAWERFTKDGPVALLPLGGDRYSLVWTHPTETAERTLLLSDHVFLDRLQARFGWRLGKFLSVGQRAVYPLVLMQAKQAYLQRAALVGNSLHSLHPVAGQGFNLALRDVAVLIDVLMDMDDPGSSEGLQCYQALRRSDMSDVVRFTDGLINIFGGDAFGWGHLRGMGLLLADGLRPINRFLARQNMGLRASKTRLGSGESPRWSGHENV